jgi:dCMP deaminase
MTDRISSDVEWMMHALVTARRGTCSRLRVGAVLVRDGYLVASGRNGAPAGMPHCEHLADEPCEVSIHAEANAIIFAGKPLALGATMYCTHSPCFACAGLIINAGVDRVFYREDYRSIAGLDRLHDAGLFIARLRVEL